MKRTALALALASAFGAIAQEADELAKPSSEISVGAGVVTNDNQRFGQYTGMVKEDVYGLIDFDVVRRNDEAGRWLILRGRNVGLEHRELRFEQLEQGNWGYFIDFSQTPRFSPYIANTAVQGIGTGNLTIPYPAATSAKRHVQLDTERQNVVLGAQKLWRGGWDVKVRFRNEEKTGARIFSRGTTGATGGHEFTPEPIDYLTQELEATLGFSGERLQLSSGYYGSFFKNQNHALNINNQPGGPTALGVGPGAFTPLGLPPDNDSHQLHVAGGYSFTPVTRATFKLARARLTQEDQFIVAPSAFVPRTDLGARIDTTQAQLGLATRLGRLGLRGDLRYEDRDDRTPVHFYQTFNATTLLTPANSATATTNGQNEPRSIRTTAGKVEATYGLPAGFRVTGGVDYEEKKRNTSDVRSVSHRYETEEIGWRAELRRSLGDTLNGALAFLHSERDGSDWLTTTTLNGAAGSNLVHPLHLADRDRDKVRAVLDWAPLEPLSLQFVAEHAKDEYSGRTLGPREGTASLYSVDATYSFSESWQAIAWASRNDIRAEQVTCQSASGTGVCPNTAANPIWEARLRTLGNAFGLGLRAKPTGVIELGADVVHTRDRNEFRQEPLPVPNPVGTPLADVRYKRTILGLSGRYALDKSSGVRLQYIYDQFSTDDYNWSAWVYTDGTRLRQDETQQVHFVGLAYYYQFR